MVLKCPESAKDRIILALDTDTIEDVEKYTKLLSDYVGYFKVGLQLYSSCGYEAVRVIKENGGKVYFDGKFLDIPNTVAKTCANLIKNGIDFFNVAANGGSKMMSNTVRLCRETAKHLGVEPPTILAVALLSSFGQRTLTEELNITLNTIEYVSKIAQIAKDSGVDGIVAAAGDSKKVKQELGQDFLVICPAVRPTWSVVNDQVRVVSPSDAINSGSDYMIIGRPITSASDPKGAVQMVIDEIENALENKEKEYI